MLMTRGALAAKPQLRIACGTAADVDAAAALADPRHALLRAAWFDAAAPRRLSRIIARRENGSPVAAIPLGRRRGVFSTAQVAGSYWPFRSFPVAQDASADELTAVLRSPLLRRAAGLAWRLGPLFDNDPILVRLREAAPAAGWTILQRRLGTCFEIDVQELSRSGPWPRAATLKKNRYREKSLGGLGPVAYRTFTGGTWGAEQLDAIAAIEQKSWLAALGDKADTQFADPAQRRRWEAEAQDPVLAGMLFCSLLTVGDVPVAFTFGLEVGRVRYHIANNYDAHFARHSPGKILLYKDFEAAAARGVERISWGSGDAGYKSEMGAQPGPEILDLLLVRPPLLALPLRRLWTGSFQAAE